MTCSKEKGRSNATHPKDITRLFNYLNVPNNAVFCDLGCGNGELCIKSVNHVKEAIGFECDAKRYLIAKKKSRDYDNISIYKENYTHKKAQNKIKKGTIFYSTNELDVEFLKILQRKIGKNKYIIQYYFPPCPIKPQFKVGWYYVIKTPFKFATTKKEWIKSLCGTNVKNYKELRNRIQRYFPDYDRRFRELQDDLTTTFRS